MFRLVFILYCLEAGLLLLVLPWTPLWDHTLVQIPFDTIRNFLLLPVVRGAVSGFGAVHLIWVLHDLVGFFRGRGRETDPQAPTVRGS